jgi:hypothetical protein
MLVNGVAMHRKLVTIAAGFPLSYLANAVTSLIATPIAEAERAPCISETCA